MYFMKMEYLPKKFRPMYYRMLQNRNNISNPLIRFAHTNAISMTHLGEGLQRRNGNYV